jgi:hypothetical protein
MSSAPQATSRWSWVAGSYRAVIFLAALAIIVWVFVDIVGVRVDLGSGSSHLKPDFPGVGPAEFLYLDSARVDAYLAQIDGGSFESEKLSQKYSDTLSGKLEIAGTAEAGGSSSRESSSEREVKPTEASRFFSLYTALKEDEDLHEVRLREFRSDLGPLEEGQIIVFRTSALSSPIYVNPYLASRDPGSVTSLFPGSAETHPENAVARAGTARLKRQLGDEPRAVFALRPEGKDSAEYLMPVQAELISHENSLLKYGGGEFTVVGKLIRRFPEGSDKHVPAYVDSATRAEWERPIRIAPGELICRTEPRCLDQAQTEELKGRARDMLISAARERERNSLRAQTTIDGRGAVILPIAIYK